MLQLVYTSRACERLSETDLQAIYQHSATRNETSGVTGLLLFDTVRFMQALEGEEAVVLATMARIATDPRHENISYLGEHKVDQRQFGGWSMDCKTITRGTTSDNFLTKATYDVRLVDDPSLRAAFIGFAILGSRM